MPTGHHVGTEAEMQELCLQAQGPEDAGPELGAGGKKATTPNGLRGSLALTTPRGWTSSLPH